MAQIILEIISQPGHQRPYYPFDRTFIKIGRSFSCDLTLADLGVDSEHASLQVIDKQKIVLTDLQSQNGIYVVVGRERKRIQDHIVLESGSVFVVGETQLRVFLAHHPIPPTRVYKNEPVSVFHYEGRLLLGYILIAYFLLMFWDIAANYKFTDSPVGKVVEYAFNVLIAVAVWAGIWSLLGRLIRHQAKFITHFIHAILFVIIIIFIHNFVAYVGFVLASPAMEGLLSAVYGMAAVTYLLFGHLTFATHIPIRQRWWGAVIPPIIVGILVSVSVWSSKNDFAEEPPLYGRLRPPIIQPLETIDIKTCVKNTKTVFDQLKYDH